jgi:hypothetical protein
VSRSEEKGTAAGTETVTASGQVVRRCSSIDPVAASSSGLASARDPARVSNGEIDNPTTERVWQTVTVTSGRIIIGWRVGT